MIIEEPKILYLFSAPLIGPDNKPMDTLDVDGEINNIVRELNACNHNILLRIGIATTDELSLGIADKFNILHISGHGHPDYLIFEDGKGGSQCITGDYLKRLIFTEGLFKIAIVSACHSQQIGEMLANAGVEHVVAIKTDTDIFDNAATVFIREFYRNLFRKESIQKSFEMAKLLVEGDPSLTKIKPHLEDIAEIKEEIYPPKEEKFVLLPEHDSRHSKTSLSKNIKTGSPIVDKHILSKTNLPTRPQSFTGRSEEMYEIINELLTHRLVTITGAGGIGKTIVAVEVARWFHTRRYFPDGIFHVDLRQTEKIDAVIGRLSTILKLPLNEIKGICSIIGGKSLHSDF